VREWSYSAAASAFTAAAPPWTPTTRSSARPRPDESRQDAGCEACGCALLVCSVIAARYEWRQAALHGEGLTERRRGVVSNREEKKQRSQVQFMPLVPSRPRRRRALIPESLPMPR